MKTIDDLKALLPTLLELFSQENHEIGESYWDQDEDGWGKCEDYEDNSFIYEEDGWSIEVNYRCCGEFCNDPGDYWTPPCYDLIRAWGEVTEITACHYDEETDEEIEFSDEDLKVLWDAFEEELSNI
ncbi:MAG: hypothetical protein K2N88_03790 [Muribaculaceae bacterium]|nr:hypothetical protein [Muribaculaceae bacterium]